MAEMEVEIDGMKEKWQEWVLPGGKEELDGLPGALKPVLRSLARRPVELTPPGKLVNYYDEIDKLTRDKENGVTDADIAPYLARIADRVQRLSEEGERREKTVVRELPLHIGAVFKEGRNVLSVEHKSIPILDIKEEKDRREYILQNIHAFDVLLRQPTAWKEAEDIWFSDALIAAQGVELDKETFRNFEKDLKATMAVTASARLMETSGGDLGSYLTMITGGAEKPLNSRQEEWADFLLHNDPKKLNQVLEMPLIKDFYAALMDDAGLIHDGRERWHEEKVAGEENKTIWQPGWLTFKNESNLAEIKNGKLVNYLKDFGKKGGFAGYINEVLLASDIGNDFSDDSRWAAARLACDAFLVDLYTRWQNGLTAGGKEKLNLKPAENWGGNPLDSILSPSSLLRAKGVYIDQPFILDWIDASFRPLDIFKDGREKDVLMPSMTVNLKKLGRYNDALNSFLGDSMGSGIPRWDDKTMYESLPHIISQLDQLYGGIKEGDKPLGKHIVGAMVMRILYTKVAAAMVESSKPGFFKLIGTNDKENPFYPVLVGLFGPNLDNRSGLIKKMTSSREGLILRGNMFGAEKTYKYLVRVLRGGERTQNIRFALELLESLSGLFGGGGKR